MLVAYPIETVLLGALAFVVGGPIEPGAVVWGCLYGIGMAFGMWAFYAALVAGPISVVSPLAAVLNAAVPVAVGVALGSARGKQPRSASCWRWSRCCLSAARPQTRAESPYRFTPKVAWLTVLAGWRWAPWR
jgi:hypothetical protein